MPTEHSTYSERGIAPGEWLGLALLVIGVIGGSLAGAYAGGSIDIPYGDDWSFSRAALTLGETGELELLPWGEPTLVGHLVWAYPFLALFGSSLAALHWAVAVAGVVGLVATFVVMRRFLDPVAAFLGTALIALLPYYGVLATTYMTDVTAFAAQMLCLALGLAALDREPASRRALLAASLTAGLFGFAIREIVLVAPLAIVAGHMAAARRDGRRLVPLGAALGAVMVVAVAFYAWRQGLPGDLERERPGASTRSLFLLGQAFFTVAFGALPALLLGAGALWRRRSGSVLVAAGAALALAAFVASWELRHDLPFNITLLAELFRPGEHPLAFLPTALWALMTAVALLAGLLLAVGLAVGGGALATQIRARRSLDPGVMALLAVGVLYAAALVVRALQGEALHDRYVLGLMVPVVALALALPSRERSASRSSYRIAVGATLLVAPLTALAVVTDRYFFGEQWNAGERAVGGRLPAQRVDAGFAWVGFHAAVVTDRPPSRNWRDPFPWYASVFPESGNCLTVSSEPLSHPRLRLTREVVYEPPLDLGDSRFRFYRNEAACGTR